MTDTRTVYEVRIEREPESNSSWQRYDNIEKLKEELDTIIDFSQLHELHDEDVEIHISTVELKNHD